MSLDDNTNYEQEMIEPSKETLFEHEVAKDTCKSFFNTLDGVLQTASGQHEDLHEGLRRMFHRLLVVVVAAKRPLAADEISVLMASTPSTPRFRAKEAGVRVLMGVLAPFTRLHPVGREEQVVKDSVSAAAEKTSYDYRWVADTTGRLELHHSLVSFLKDRGPDPDPEKRGEYDHYCVPLGEAHALLAVNCAAVMSGATSVDENAKEDVMDYATTYGYAHLIDALNSTESRESAGKALLAWQAAMNGLVRHFDEFGDLPSPSQNGVDKGKGSDDSKSKKAELTNFCARFLARFAGMVSMSDRNMLLPCEMIMKFRDALESFEVTPPADNDGRDRSVTGAAADVAMTKRATGISWRMEGAPPLAIAVEQARKDMLLVAREGCRLLREMLYHRPCSTPANTDNILWWEREQEDALRKISTPLDKAETVPVVVGTHDSPICVVAASPDGQFLVTGSCDCTAKVWDVANKQCWGTLRGHAGPVLGAAFSPCQRFIATSGGGGVVKLWSTTAGLRLRADLELHDVNATVLVMSFAPNCGKMSGPYLVVGFKDGRVATFNFEELTTVVASNIPLQAHDGPISELLWTCENMVTTGLSDGRVKVWDDSCDIVYTIDAHTEDGRQENHGGSGGNDDNDDAMGILCAATTPWRRAEDKEVLATAGRDGTIKLWDMDTRELYFKYSEIDCPIASISWDVQGKQLVTASQDGRVAVWDIYEANLDTGNMECSALLDKGNMECSALLGEGEGRPRSAIFCPPPVHFDRVPGPATTRFVAWANGDALIVQAAATMANDELFMTRVSNMIEKADHLHVRQLGQISEMERPLGITAPEESTGKVSADYCYWRRLTTLAKKMRALKTKDTNLWDIFIGRLMQARDNNGQNVAKTINGDDPATEPRKDEDNPATDAQPPHAQQAAAVPHPGREASRRRRRRTKSTN